ncbi:MAG: carbonic anhydrase [Mycobacterium leprae]
MTTRDVATAAEGLVPLEPAPRSPREALARLLAGNRRWVNGEPRHPHQATSRRRSVAAGQAPFAAVLTCIDSRVPPELLFDQGLGDVLVIRTAGQAVDRVALGSLEFGPDELRVPLVFVLGHERCGAVTAAIAAIRQHRGRAPGHIQHVVDALRPAYTLAVRQPIREGGDLVDTMVRAQTRLTVAQLRRDHLLAERLRRGALAVVGGRYDLDTGRVEVIA